MILARAGQVIHGPDGQGYRLKRDIRRERLLMADDLEAFGGAPEPQRGELLPDWVMPGLAKLAGTGRTP